MISFTLYQPYFTDLEMSHKCKLSSNIQLRIFLEAEAERYYRTLDYFKSLYEEDYTKYSRLFEEIGDEVHGITNLYEGFQNSYNPAYVKMKKIKELAEQIRLITQPTTPIARIEEYVTFVKEHTTM